MRSRVAILAIAVAAASLTLVPGRASAKELFAESFTGDTVSAAEWKAISTYGNHQPCLTAAPADSDGTIPACNAVKSGDAKPDEEGSGAFQLTDNTKNQSGALLLDKAIDADQGLHIEFDMFHYRAKPYKDRGGDGISFFLVDGEQPDIEPGGTGGGLGYKGLDGAVIGVGFDEYGNFSTKSKKEFSTGPGITPHSLVLRGAQGTGYQYIKGKKVPASLAADKATSRSDARRTVNIDISTENVLTVYIDFHDGKGRQKILDGIHLDEIKKQPKLPDTIKLGFAGSTGNATAIHEIQGFKVSSLDPDLKTTVRANGDFKQGGSGAFEVGVANGKDDGPTTGKVTTTFTAPAGLTPKQASGDGWTCEIEGQNATCERPGTGEDTLHAGDPYPPITVSTTVAADAPEGLTVKAVTDTPEEHKPADNTATTTVRVEQNPPDVSIKVTPAGPIQEGGTGVITAVVTDDPEAGPATGQTTITVPAPPGTQVVSAEGDGWRCTTTSADATCTRTDPLQPGQSFPPANVTIKVPPNAPDKLPIEGEVSTPGDKNDKNDRSTSEVPVEAAPPNLAVGIQPSGGFVAGGDGTLTATVWNSGNAGPTTGKVEVDIPVPAGVMVTSASGDGWSCKPAKETVTCTRPGTGDDALRAGTRYPPVVVKTQASPATVSATVSTPGDSDTTDNSTSTTQRQGYWTTP